MTTFEHARRITALTVFVLVALTALYFGNRGWNFTTREALRKEGSTTLWLVRLWMKVLPVAVVLTFSVLAYAKDWQIGRIEFHPPVVRDIFADYKGHLYRDSQLGYTCMDGDVDNAPVCVSDEHSLIVVKPGYATVTLADGTQFIVPDYLQAGEAYNPSLGVSRDVECDSGIYRPLENDDYQCTIFKRLSLRLTPQPTPIVERPQPDELKELINPPPVLPTCGGCEGKALTEKTAPSSHESGTFLYRLGPLRNGVREITIKDIGKGFYTGSFPSQTPPLPEIVRQNLIVNSEAAKASPAEAAIVANVGHMPSPEELALLVQSGEASRCAVITTPSGAEVFVDSNRLGVSPVAFVLLKEAQTPRMITIKMAGYKTVEKSFVPDGKTIPIAVVLEKDSQPH